jgi:hypothetical protein
VSSAVDVNQRALAGQLDRLADALRALAEGDAQAEADVDGSTADGAGEPEILDRLAASFGLSGFERELLLLCAGVELDARFTELCAAAAGEPPRRRPTFGLAMAALAEGHWSALAPAAPLRRWRLLELEAGETLMTSALRIDELVLHHLTGIDYIDPRLSGLVIPVERPAVLPESLRPAALRLARCCSSATPAGVAVITGADRDTRRSVVAAGVGSVGLGLFALQAADMPTTAEERDALARLWEREAILHRSALVIELEDSADGQIRRRAASFLDEVSWGAIASARDRLRVGRPVPQVEVSRPGPAEQRRLWQSALGDAAQPLNGSLDELIAQFDLGADAIASAAAGLDSELPDLPGQLWEACRAQGRPELDDLAQRIVARAGWADLVVAPDQLLVLREIAMHVRARRLVHETWGFAGKSARGLGVSALFEGASGTGKTMAAEVLANELRLDLYRIDLSQVVSKYIGETEKNLRRVFDAAEAGGAILLFDEADALFGKRSEVRDSHDRYANIEVSYLLARMEAYRGLAILTTNAKDAIDSAFTRRIRFVVRFAFPDAAERAEIWRRAFPPETPTDELDATALAAVSFTGGSISNVALGAAFLAADEGDSVRMRHVARAAMRERAKLERPLPAAEVSRWT